MNLNSKSHSINSAQFSDPRAFQQNLQKQPCKGQREGNTVLPGPGRLKEHQHMQIFLSDTRYIKVCSSRYSSERHCALSTDPHDTVKRMIKKCHNQQIYGREFGGQQGWFHYGTLFMKKHGRTHTSKMVHFVTRT